MTTNRYCQAGKNHIWLRQDNSAQLCCQVNNALTHRFQLNNSSQLIPLVQSDEFKTAYASLENGPLSNGDCQQCVWEDEHYPGHGQRLKLNRLTNQGEKFFLKVDLSNKCNLKCVMCSSGRSTSWIKDEIALKNILVDHPELIVEPEPYETIGDGWWENAPGDWWDNVGVVEISGGEPLYQPEAVNLITFLATNYPDCELRIITNATIVEEKVLDTLSSVKSLNFSCSVDAWEEDVYQYSRGGVHSIEQVKTNILKLVDLVRSLPKGRVGICDTIHPINYDQGPLGEKFVSEWQQTHNSDVMHHYINMVHSRNYMDIRRVLPKNLYAKSSEEIVLQKQFFTWITALDKVRNTNILAIRPEFEEWFHHINNQQ